MSVLTNASHSATVMLSNGDRLSGTITASTGDTVTLEHPLLGELLLPLAEIAAIDPVDLLLMTFDDSYHKKVRFEAKRKLALMNLAGAID